MNMRERKFWKYLKRKLEDALPSWKFQRVENKSSNYMPDVYYSAQSVCGWLELKVAEINLRDYVHLSHFTRGQRNWIIREGKNHDFAWCLIKIQDRNEFILLDWEGVLAIREFESVPWGVLIKVARRVWCDGMDIGSLAMALVEPYEEKTMAVSSHG